MSLIYLVTKVCHVIPSSWANRKPLNYDHFWNVVQQSQQSRKALSTTLHISNSFLHPLLSSGSLWSKIWIKSWQSWWYLKAFFKYRKDNINLLCQISHRPAFGLWSVWGLIPALCKSQSRNNQYGNFTRIYGQIQGCRNEITKCLKVGLECHKLPVFFTKKTQPFFCCLKYLKNPMHSKSYLEKNRGENAAQI